jgi:CO/xanthine dehydrogenase FAD-binding subunit
MPLLSFRMARPAYLVDLNRCEELSYIRQDRDVLAIGAMTRQSEAEHADAVHRHCPLLRSALRHMGHPTIRNRGTVGGSIAHADPGAELPTVAVALKAEIMLQSAKAMRTVAAADFFVDSLVTVVEPDELVVEVRFPLHRPGDRVAFAESGVRRMDLAIAGVAVHLHVDESDVCSAASVVALGGGTRPTRLTSVEAALVGRSRSDIDIRAAARTSQDDVDPPGDLQASRAYRQDLIVALTRDALSSALSKEASA